MDFIIAPDLLERYPSFRVMIITAKNLQTNDNDSDIDKLLDQQQEEIQNSFQLSELPEHPHIAEWRKTYTSFGSKPSKYRCAVEALLRAILKRGSLPRINSLVNLCNYVAIKHILPIDIMDVSNIKGDVAIRFARGDESFLPLGALELDNPYQGEVIYADAEDVLGRRWNWRKCDKNKVTPLTKDILCTVEGIGAIETQKIEQAAEELAALIQRFYNCLPESRLFSSEMPRSRIF